MSKERALNIFAVALAALAISAIVVRNVDAGAPVSLLNVSYDPTRELYARLNPAFVAAYRDSGGKHVELKQAHGGSSRQARAVIDGTLEADLVGMRRAQGDAIVYYLV